MGRFDDLGRYEAALRHVVLDELFRQGPDQWTRMSNSELSRRSGISVSEIGRLLSDEEPKGRSRPPWTAEKMLGIARALGLAPSELTERAERRYGDEAERG